MDVSGALRRSWWLLVVLGAAGLVVGVLLPVSHQSTRASRPSARAWQARTVVGTAPAGGGNQVAGDVTAAQIQFYGSSIEVKQATARAAGLDVPESRYSAYLSASVVPGTSGVQAADGGTVGTVVLIARGRTEAQATALATDYAKQLGDYLTFLATTSAIARAAPGATVVAGHTGYQVLQPATATTVATATSAATSSSGSAGTRWLHGLIGLLIGLLVGLVLAVIVALVRQRRDRYLRSAEGARASFGFPVVVEIPVAGAESPTSPGQYPMVDVVRNPDSPGAEAYRMLRMSLLFEAVPPAAAPAGPGADGGEGEGEGEGEATGGATVAAANGSDPKEAGDRPGAVLTEPEPEAGPPTEKGDKAAQQFRGAMPADPAGSAGRKVVLVVSAGNELTRPHVAANLGAIYGEAGQKVVVISTWDVEAGAVPTHDGPEVPGADRIRARDVEARLEPSRLDHVYRLSLSSFVNGSAQLATRGARLLDAARRICDVVIVDVPPMLALHHAEALSHAADVVLVVGECGYTTGDDARRAGELLRRIGAPVLGVVLTNVALPSGDIRQTVPRHHPAPTATLTPAVSAAPATSAKPTPAPTRGPSPTTRLSPDPDSDPDPDPSPEPDPEPDAMTATDATAEPGSRDTEPVPSDPT